MALTMLAFTALDFFCDLIDNHYAYGTSMTV